MIVYVYIFGSPISSYFVTLLLCYFVVNDDEDEEQGSRRMIVYVCTVAQLIDGQWQ